MRKRLEKNLRKYITTGIAMTIFSFCIAFAVPGATKAASKKPTGMSLNITAKTIDIKGTSTISVKSVRPSKASKAVTYKSGNKKVATVSSKGVVTGKKAGKVKITVTSKSNKKLKKSVSIIVKDLKPSSLSLNTTKATLYVGQSKNIKATVKPAAVYCPLRWTSSNTSVATVSGSGKITAKKAGTATITVRTTQKTSKKKYLTKTCKVTVKDKKVTPPEKEETSKRQIFVSPSWLENAQAGKEKGYENIFLAEVSSEKTEGLKAYNEGHIPDAYHINADTVQHNDPEQLGEFLKTNGITKDTKVILYGKNATDSNVAKVAFTLLYAGVEDVKIVDGGMDAWKTTGFATETVENLAKAGADDYRFGTIIPAHPEYILSGEEVKEKLQSDADFRLVSICSDAEFCGEKTSDASTENAGEPLGAVWGHDTADGSYTEKTTEKNTETDTEIKKTAGIDKVKAILAASDSTLNHKLSFYSSSEGKETIPFLICYQNNVKNISIYAGGWKEWQSNYQEDPENWPMQKVTPEEAKTYGTLSLARKEISTDSEGHRLMAQEAIVAENPLTCWPERIRKHITYTYGTELSNSIVNVDLTGKVTTTGFGDAVIVAKTETSNKVSYTIHVQKGEDYFYSSASWDSMYLDADTVISAVKSGDLNVLDIRFAQQELNGVEAGYAAGHIKGSIWTPAWPTKTASAQANVRKEAERIKNSENPTVIVCMAGAEGAKRAAAVLMDAGVAKSKLRILSGGGKNLVMNYKDQLVTGIKE